VSDSLGPFKLTVPVRIEVQAADEAHQVTATVSGNDSRGQARIKGTLEATVEPGETSTRIALSMHLEILGKLASLGAAPIRRRADQVFSKFAQCVQAELDAE
jgi:carbon monoxide dehydrogenase subunit G